MSDQITNGEVEFEIMHIYVCEEEKFPESSKEMCSSGTTANRRSSSALVSCVQEIAVLNSGVGTGRMASAAYGTGGLYTAVKTIQIRTRLHTLQTQSSEQWPCKEGGRQICFVIGKEKCVFFKL